MVRILLTSFLGIQIYLSLFLSTKGKNRKGSKGARSPWSLPIGTFRKTFFVPFPRMPEARFINSFEISLSNIVNKKILSRIISPDRRSLLSLG